ncbi:NAD(P)-dependent oxidoreductase [Candidatus Woesearchaeota archaeon]|nr:NAD(P)-dependent oxidoreductase [Candidatus Woesearchaeota archaeon]
MYKKIALFGGSGKLGRELNKSYEFLAPSEKEVDVTNYDKIYNYLEKTEPEILIHAAALVGAKECEENKEKAYNVNVNGTYNVARACAELKIKLVYISTDTIFDGKKGDYKEEDMPNPINFYSLTKLIGESYVKMVENSLIIRTSFFDKNNFPYKKVFIDQYTCRMPLDELVKDIMLTIKINLKGVVHIAGKRDTLYNIIKKYNPKIEKTTRKESGLNLPEDLSLNTDKWNKIKGEFK